MASRQSFQSDVRDGGWLIQQCRKPSGTGGEKSSRNAKPADLAVQQRSKFELVIDLKTAKALGVTMPRSILARANDVIH